MIYQMLPEYYPDLLQPNFVQLEGFVCTLIILSNESFFGWFQLLCASFVILKIEVLSFSSNNIAIAYLIKFHIIWLQ